MGETKLQISRDKGIIQAEPVGDGSFKVTLLPNSPDLYIPRRTCSTIFPWELIEYLANRWDFAWFCDVLSRYDESDSVATALKKQLFGYFASEDFRGKTILDFGCGDGASSIVMAKALPQTEIIGVELDKDRIDTANRIKSSIGLSNLHFLCSPSGDSLPSGLGKFDFVMMSAVYEHLLPSERKIVMPLIWAAMKPGASIFINQTPYRYSPYEAHSSGLWLVNYMPDRMAHFMVRYLSKRNGNILKSEDWEVHLRGGMRGGTEKEIIRNLTKGDTCAARVLQPKQNGIRDRADLWLSAVNQSRHRRLKGFIASGFRLTDRWWGTIPRLNLEVVIQKAASAGP